MKCDSCENESVHSDETQNLCTECMDKKGLVWDCYEQEFTPEYIDCPECGGYMPWCSICKTYTQSCCIEYGT